MTKTPNTPPLDAMLCANVYALNLAFSRFYQTAFGETGFTYPKFVVLLALDEAGPMSLSDLSAKVGTEANTLSPMVKKMSEFGILERVRDTKDERRVLITLQPFGKAVLEEANKVMNEGCDILGLDSAEVQSAVKVLTNLRKKLETVEPATRFAIPKRPEDQ